jgi:hypothetical protein
VACAVAGQTWLYEHVERASLKALGDGYVDAAPYDASVPLFTGVAAAAVTLVCGSLAWRRRPTSATMKRPLLSATVAGLLVGAASFFTVMERTDWLRGTNVILMCQPASAAPTGSIVHNGCVVAQPPASGAWILGAIALGSIAMIILPTDRIATPPSVSPSPMI